MKNHKLTRIALILYCALFLLVCLFFSAGMLFGRAEGSADSGPEPHLIEEGRVNDDFGNQFEKWFSKSFAFRDRVVDMFSFLRENILSAGNDQVIVGKDRFLFFGETAGGYISENRMSDEEIDAAAEAVGALSRYAGEHGARFLFVAAPNKNTVYPEKMPSQYLRSDEPTELDRLLDKLDDSGTPYLDLRPVLLQAKTDGLLYHKRDTHWNAYGAGIAYREIMQTLGLKNTADPDETGEIRKDFRGDLDALLYPGKTRYDENIEYNRADRYVFTSAHATDMDMVITTRSAGENGRLLVFRDSFANALIDYMACDFSDVRFERALPFNAGQLEKEHFDFVIIEIAERNLRNLIGSDGRIAEDEQ